MKVNIVLNACTDDYKIQAQQIEGFLEEYCKGLTKGLTFIIANSKEKHEELLGCSPTNHVEWIWVKEYQPETVLLVLAQRMNSEDIYLFGNDASGTELAVRAAFRAGGTSAINVNLLKLTNLGVEIGKRLYSNHMQGMFLANKAPYCISIAKGTKKLESNKNNKEYIIDFESDVRQTMPAFLSYREVEKIEKPIGLADAKVLLVVGQGIKNKEALKELEVIANKLSASLGVSRPVAMNAWAPMDRLIGVSGVMACPAICIAAGVSGAAAFYAGIEKSEFIVAINIDERAPIMKKANVAIVGNYQIVLRELIQYINN